MSSYAENSIFSKAYNPYLFAALLFGVSLVITAGGKLIQLMGADGVGERFPWLLAASFMLLFAVFNSIFSLSSQNSQQYWSRSMFSFMGLALANGLVAWLFSGLSIGDAGSYRWIYVVVTVVYLVFMSMMGFMKKIVEFAEREEWNQPRLRKRGKRK
jgi:hypothetical protein